MQTAQAAPPVANANRTARWTAAAVLLFGLAVTIATSLWARERTMAEVDVQQDRQADLLQRDIEKRLALPAYGLKGARGAVAALDGVPSRRAFQAYVAARDLDREFPGVRGFGFLERIAGAALPAFATARQRDAGPDFQLKGLGALSPHYIVTQIEPVERNLPAWGRDLGSEPMRRGTIEAAIASGEATLSDPLQLVQDMQKGPGFLLMVPVYRGGQDPGTVEGRRAALLGLLYAPLVAREVLQGAAQPAAALLDVRLSARNADGRLVPLLAVHNGRDLGLNELAGFDISGGPLAQSQRFNVHGHEFVLDTALNEDAGITLLGTTGAGLALAGTLLSLLLAVTAWLLVAGRQRAEALARGMTADLQRLAMVASRTTNAVVITDAQRRIVWVNEGFCRVTGYSLEEARGHEPDALLEAPGADPLAKQRMSAALDAGDGCRAELRNRAKDGRLYWIELEVQPLRDAAGRISGFMAIESDITDRKEAEQALALERNRYADILESQSELICRIASDGRVNFANEAFCRYFGVSAAELSTRDWAPLLHADDRERVRREVGGLRPEAPSVVLEHRVHVAGDQTRWVQFVCHAFFDADGQLIETQSVGRDITERKQLEAEVQEARATLQDLYDNAPCAYYALDGDGRFLSVNALGLRWTGCSAAELIGRLGPTDFFDAEGRALFAANFERFKREGRVKGLEFNLTGRDGRTRRVSLSATAIYAADGSFARSRSVMFDVTETHRIREQLHQVTRDQESMLENELVGIVKLRERRATWHNRALEQMFGYTAGELDNASARSLYPDERSYQALGEQAYAQLARGERFRTQLQMRRKDGSLIWVDLSGMNLPGDVGSSLWMMVDITQSKAHEARMERAALHDALTGLPNRLLLADRLSQAIRTAERSGQGFSLAYLDLNGFKQVNDSLGHDAGDEVLRVVAARLLAGLRASDTVARLGGDEFVLLLTPGQSPHEPAPVLSRLLDALGQPITLGSGDQVRVGASLGLAHYPADGSTPDALMRHADEQMFANKRAGRLSRQGADALR